MAGEEESDRVAQGYLIKAISGMATPLETPPAYQPRHDNINIKVARH